MTENDPTSDPILDALPADTSITPPSADLAPADGSSGGVGAAPPDASVPERLLVQKPRWPHPSFGWALLWCLLFWIVTQIPGAIVVAVVVAVVAIVSPETLSMEKLSKPEELYKMDVFNTALGLGQFLSEILVVGFSWLVIRLVAGRDWMRQLAVRRPGAAHTLLVLACFPAMSFLGNVAYELVRKSRWVPSISDKNPLNLVYFWTAVFVVLGAAVLASWLIAGFRWTRKLAARPARPVDLMGAVAIVPVLVLCVLILYAWLHGLFRTPGLENTKIGGMEEMADIIRKWPWGFAVLVIGLGPGIGEELWCRGFLGRGLVGSHGAVLGVLASSFLFGLIHGDPCQGVMAMVMGLWLHFVYLCTRSLWLPMLLHFLNNSLSVMETRFLPRHVLDAKLDTIPLPMYLTALLLLMGIAYALYQSRARLAAKLPEQVLLWRPAFEGVEYPSTGSTMRVVHPLPSLTAILLAGSAFAAFVGACIVWFSHG